MQVETKIDRCPSCQKQINIRYKISEYRAAIKTDLSCTGACAPVPPYNECEQCRYLFYDEDAIEDKDALKEFIGNDTYSNLFNRYAQKPYYLISLIYQQLNLSFEHIARALLYNYYDTKSLADFQTLIHFIEDIKRDILYENAKRGEFFDLLRGEYYRRTREFEKAKEIFFDLKEESYRQWNKCDFQLKLIGQKDDRLQLYCLETKKYAIDVPVLDGVIEKGESNDAEIIDEYIFSFRDSLRYDEFEQGLKNLKKANIDLQASNEEGNMLHAILDLMCYANSECAQDEVKKIFETALLQYDIDPALMIENKFGCNCTIIDILKYDILWDFGQRKKHQFVDEIRDALFQYAQKQVREERVGFMPLKQQQILLMTQLPYFEKVSKLYSMGFLFDRAFFDDHTCYNDIIHYTADIGSASMWCEFYEQEFPHLYDLLVFLIENALPKELDNSKILQSVEAFDNDRIYKQIEMYLQNR